MRQIGFLLVLCLGVLLPGAPAVAQISQGGMPASFELFQKQSADIDVVRLGDVDVQKLLAEDEAERGKDVPFRFGYPFDVDYSLENSGTWETLPDGSRLWRLRIEAPGAYSINLIYSRYWLPSGARLWVYSEDHEMVIGAFTSFNNKLHGKMATSPVKGDVCILEYYEPANVSKPGEITISRVVHAYKDIFGFLETKGFGSSGSCNNNVNCPEGADWQDHKRGVAMVLLSSGTRWCSGSLVNNVRQDGTPYFLTANHCLGSEETWIIMFNYESPGCTNINGPTDMTVQGTTLLASYSSSDFGLLLLDETPPESYSPYYNGWSTINTASTTSTAIHHPSGDIKKISFDYDPVTSANYLQTSGTTHWRVGNWEDGTTEGGSSGSPLFDQNQRIVGQLHGGYASCTSITADWYGKFSMSWLGGGSSSNQLKHWLDPDNTGAQTIDGYDPYAGVHIAHDPPLDDTQDTLNAYEVIADIASVTDLVPFELKLHYEISSVWYEDVMTATGQPDIFHAFIPAQPPYTDISYYISAMDIENNTDTTDTFMFSVLPSAASIIIPGTIIETVLQGDSASQMVTIESVGSGPLDYAIQVVIDAFKNKSVSRLFALGEVEPASRQYEPEFLDYIEIKGSEDYRTGQPVTKNAGGPDSFGYFWVDSDEAGGPTFSWIDISGTGTDITADFGDDTQSGPYSIGFAFPFYGNVYTDFYLGSNGLIGFSATDIASRYKTAIPGATTPDNFIAWLWDDLDITDGDNTTGRVLYQNVGNRMVITFENYPEYRANPGDVITAQVILDTDGSITIQYLDVAPGFDVENCAVGIENEDGTDGLEVVYLAPYLKDDLAVRFYMPYQWLTLDSYGGSIIPGSSDLVEATVTSGELEPGEYTASVVITSNSANPGESPWTIPVIMTVEEEQTYMCGDANGDLSVGVGDAILVINYVFKGGPPPSPLGAGDANCDGSINVADATYIINFVFMGGAAPCCP